MLRPLERPDGHLALYVFGLVDNLNLVLKLLPKLLQGLLHLLDSFHLLHHLVSLSSSIVFPDFLLALQQFFGLVFVELASVGHQLLNESLIVNIALVSHVDVEVEIPGEFSGGVLDQRGEFGSA
jgi:hypothetical protein